MDRSQVQITRLQDQGGDSFVAHLSTADRIATMWPLTLDAWSFKDPTIAKPRLQRHVIQVVRREG